MRPSVNSFSSSRRGVFFRNTLFILLNCRKDYQHFVKCLTNRNKDINTAQHPRRQMGLIDTESLTYNLFREKQRVK